VGIRSIPRRGLMKLGTALVALAWFTPATSAGGANDQPLAQVPAPAQVPQPSPPAADLTRGPWRWLRTEYGDGRTLAPVDPSRYTIALRADGGLAIQADCNRGTGRYTANGPQLTIQPAAITLAACGPGSQSEVFLRDLRQVATYVFDGPRLVLNLRIDTGNMVFEPLPAASLTGAPWRVTNYNNGRGGVVNVLRDTELTATFGDDGNVSGNTGCNSFRGPYRLEGETLALGPLVSTRRACLSAEANVQEQAFLVALAAAARFELAGDRLTLRDAVGSTQVVMSRAAAQTPPKQTEPAPAEGSAQAQTS
jgi:heat shock protein HslJ